MAITLDGTTGITTPDSISHSGDTNTAIRFPAADTVTVETSGAERLRVDSSGNVLVGMTSASATADGMYFDHSGFMAVSRSRPTANTSLVAQFNRKTTDGDIVQFHKDGTRVGSIGSYAGNQTYITSLGGGMKFNWYSGTQAAIEPCSTSGAPADNLHDLGGSGSRWQDLYLSGGVYLGGTGSANKLDDYEEGTFTPVLYGGSVDPSVTYSTQSGSYTKIGNTVNVLVDVRWSAQSGGSGAAIIGGLPFSSVSSYSYCAVGEKSDSWNYSTYTQYTATIINNNHARVLVSANGLGSTEFPITSLGTGAGYILFSLTYKTNA